MCPKNFPVHINHRIVNLCAHNRIFLHPAIGTSSWYQNPGSFGIFSNFGIFSSWFQTTNWIDFNKTIYIDNFTARLIILMLSLLADQVCATKQYLCSQAPCMSCTESPETTRRHKVFEVNFTYFKKEILPTWCFSYITLKKKIVQLEPCMNFIYVFDFMEQVCCILSLLTYNHTTCWSPPPPSISFKYFNFRFGYE